MKRPNGAIRAIGGGMSTFEVVSVVCYIEKLESVLRDIAGQDYRGNRSTESEMAFRALHEAGALQEVSA